ncbi:tyrosine-type recombinase/integrase [Haloactinomyces albus]|uniref:Integrase n=1 Tax=Haloactinomyces albus TaxID=1352928 RepID=A0AAE3ZDH2_9ACTN|nr:tyrosine-type recombinase/integrase [Haloactinomyces albus]MDR7301835.1 integrase [Haloactinomyces albus]MDR7304725.1 integrase [Haloactinomyces albus]
MPRKKRPEGTRAPNGASSIYQDKNGKWHGRVTVGVRDDGRSDRRHVESWDRKVVTKKVRELERARDEGNITKPGEKWTVEQWVEHWLHNIATSTTGDGGWDAYFYATKHIRKHVGAHKLPNLLPDHLEAMYRKMQKAGASSATAHQAHRTIRTALNEAVKRGYLAKNPAVVAKAPKVEEKEVEPFTREEVTQLFKTAREGRNACRWIIAIALGLRQGEVLGLRWTDVDFQEGTLTVDVQRPRPKWKHGCDGACGHKHGGHCPQRINTRSETKRPKSRAGRRPIGLPHPVLEELKQHATEQTAEREAAGELWSDAGWLFTNETGKPLNYRTDLARWKQLLSDAGVRDARLHDARHTAATVLLELGIPDRTAMEIMGWSNVALTQRYQHVTGHVLGTVAEKLGDHLWKASEKPSDEPPEKGN